MSKFALTRLAVAAAAVALPLSSAFADTMDMTAKAKVDATCKMAAAPTLDFGTLNQITAGDLTPSVTASYKCTNGTTPATFTLNGSGSPFTGSLASGSDLIPYQITWSAPGAGTGFTTAVDVTLNATLNGADYKDAPAGSYSQTVTINVNP